MCRSRALSLSALLFLAALPLSATEIPIDGRVRDSGGAGLAGARIELRPILPSHEQGARELDGRTIEPAAWTATGKDGLFELRAPGEGPWEVEVRAEGFVPIRYRLGSLSGPFSVPPVKLRPDAGLRVRVQGPEGRPLAGARVHTEPVRLWGDLPWPGWTLVPRAGTTGKDGEVRLPSFRGELLRIWAAAPGFPAREGLQARAPGETVLRLERGTLHAVEARDADGRPVNGGIVRDLQTSLVLGRTRGGRIRIAGPARETSWFLLETADGGSVRFPLPGKVRIEVPRADAARAAENVATGSLIGTVVDEEGRPAEGVEVRAIVDDVMMPEEAGRQGRVSPQGEVRIPGLRLGVKYELAVTGPGWSPLVLKLQPLEAKESRFRLTVRRARSVAGQIVDGQGRPAADAEVLLVPADMEDPVADDASAREELDRRTSTGPEGRFLLAEVPAGWYELAVRRPGFATSRHGGIEVPEGGGLADLGRIALADGEVLTGRITDPEGRAIAGVEVWVRTDDDDVVGNWSLWPTAVSGPDGLFSIGGIPAGGTTWLDLCRTGFVPAKKILFRIFSEPLPLVLQPAGFIAGRVTRPDGSPISGQSVGAEQGEISPSHDLAPCLTQEDDAESDAAGRFRLAPLAPGWYRVSWLGEVAVSAGETREVRIDIDPEEQRAANDFWGGTWLPRPALPAAATSDTAEARIEEPRPNNQRSAVIAGRILGLEPAELAQARIGIGGPATLLRVRGTVEPDGSYRIAGLFPDGWDVFAETGDRRIEETVWIPPGVTRITRDLVFEPVVDVRGRVIGPGGEPVAGAKITLEHQPEYKYELRRYPFLTMTRSDGSFAFRVPEGEYEVRAERDGYWPDSADLDTAWRKPVAVRMQRAVRLTGRLVGLSPGEIPDIEARESEGEGHDLDGRVEVDGLYSISGLGSGLWDVEAELRIRPSGRRTARAQVDIPYGATAESLDLDFLMGDLSLSGHVQGGEGHDSLWIDLAHPDGTPFIESARIENGAFRLDRLQPGSYQLRVATYDREVKVLAERTVQLPAREELVVELAPE